MQVCLFVHASKFNAKKLAKFSRAYVRGITSTRLYSLHVFASGLVCKHAVNASLVLSTLASKSTKCGRRLFVDVDASVNEPYYLLSCDSCDVSMMSTSTYHCMCCQVIAAEGEQRASRALKAAADIIDESKSALQLRYLQTLNQISAEKNSTIIFPMPIDFVSNNVKASK